MPSNGELTKKTGGTWADNKDWKQGCLEIPTGELISAPWVANVEEGSSYLAIQSQRYSWGTKAGSVWMWITKNCNFAPHTSHCWGQDQQGYPRRSWQINNHQTGIISIQQLMQVAARNNNCELVRIWFLLHRLKRRPIVSASRSLQLR